YSRKNPDVVYAVIDSAKIGKGPGFFGAKGKDAEAGLQVTEVVKGSAADKAGLKVNDVLKAVDKKEVKTQAQLDELLKGLEAGTKVALQVQRDQEVKDLAVTLEAKREGNTVLYLGALVEDGEAGVRVRFVTQDSPAAKAGLLQGDVITSIDKQEAKTSQRFLELVNTGHKAGDKLVFQVLRDNEKKELTATLEDRPAGPGQTGSVTRPFSFSYGGQRPNAQG